MSSNRKIWAIPIALAMVLMLIGAMSLSNKTAQAQETQTAMAMLSEGTLVIKLDGLSGISDDNGDFPGDPRRFDVITTAASGDTVGEMPTAQFIQDMAAPIMYVSRNTTSAPNPEAGNALERFMIPNGVADGMATVAIGLGTAGEGLNLVDVGDTIRVRIVGVTTEDPDADPAPEPMTYFEVDDVMVMAAPMVTATAMLDDDAMPTMLTVELAGLVEVMANSGNRLDVYTDPDALGMMPTAVFTQGSTVQNLSEVTTSGGDRYRFNTAASDPDVSVMDGSGTLEITLGSGATIMAGDMVDVRVSALGDISYGTAMDVMVTAPDDPPPPRGTSNGVVNKISDSMYEVTFGSGTVETVVSVGGANADVMIDLMTNERIAGAASSSDEFEFNTDSDQMGGTVDVKGDMVNDPEGPAVFNFDITIHIDENINRDSDDDDNDGDFTDCNEPRTGPGNTCTNDHDRSETISVSAHVLKVDRDDDEDCAMGDVCYDTVPADSSVGKVLTGLLGESKAVMINGVTSDMMVGDIMPDDGYFEAVADDMNGIWIKYGPMDPMGLHDDMGMLMPNMPEAMSGVRSFTAMVDTGVDTDDDGMNEMVEVDFDVYIMLRDQLMYADPKPMTFYVQDNAAMGTEVGTVMLDGVSAGEHIGVVITNGYNQHFDATIRPAGGNDAQVVITVASSLASMVGENEFDLHVSGQGEKTRTISKAVTVNVTAGPSAPMLNPSVTLDDDMMLVISVVENDMSAGILLDAMATGVLADFGDGMGIVDDADSMQNELMYELSGSAAFMISDDGKLSLMGDLPADVMQDSDGNDMMMMDANGDAMMDADGNAMMMYSTMDTSEMVTVTVMDEAGNSLAISVKLMVDVNEPPMADMAADASYLSSDPFNHLIADISALISDDDVDHMKGGDSLMYSMATTPDAAPFGIDSATGMITVRYPGMVNPDPANNWDPEIDGWSVTVTADDMYDNGDGAMVTFMINLIEHQPDTFDQDIMVPETTAAGSVIGNVSGMITDAVKFSIRAATHDGESVLSIDDSGDITLSSAVDFDTRTYNNLVLVVDGKNAGDYLLGSVIVSVIIENVNEAPMIAAIGGTPWVYEAAQMGDAVETRDMATGMDSPTVIMASDQDANSNLRYSIDSNYFDIDPMTGAITVAMNNAFDKETKDSYTVTVTVTDGMNSVSETFDIMIADSNEDPYFIEPVLVLSLPEDTPVGTEVADYDAMDPDGNPITFQLRDSDDTALFAIDEDTGKLTLASALDYEDEGHRMLTIEVNAQDNTTGEAEIALEITVTDVNDNAPVFEHGSASITVMENTPRGTALASSAAPNGMYVASDADGTSPNNRITYRLDGPDAKSFAIDSSTGMLTTLESLDADSGTPCGATGCQFAITAVDGGSPAMNDRMAVTVTVTNAEDSISTFTVLKANPVPGVAGGNPFTALDDVKTSMSEFVPERPSRLPTSEIAPSYIVSQFNSDSGHTAVNFVETDWASWGTVVRIEVTAESPHADCGMDTGASNNNQCVIIEVESDSGDDKLQIEAYRSAMEENRFIAAVLLVETGGTDDSDGSGGTMPVYMHGSGSIPRLEVDEEDEISIRLVGSTTPPRALDVENENPDIDNFLPEHESAFDDGDVDYTFTITDSVSGIPEPEDLVDNDGDKDYMPLVAIISTSQCHSEDPHDSSYRMHSYGGVDLSGSTITREINLWCKSPPEIRQVTDDRDFDQIDDGFDVDTKIVLPENRQRFVTFVVCDNAGNCTYFTPDENDSDEALAEITIDTVDPKLVMARTGIKWDSTDSEYDDDRSFVQVLFEDLTYLDPTTIETDDFVVEGHTIKDVHWYDVSDGDDDTAWGDDDAGTNPSRYAVGGPNNLRHHPLYQSIRNTVFIELEDELAADETPDVTVVPNGVSDSAGNEQDDGDVEADDWISPGFTVHSIVSPRTPAGSSNVLAGDGDEVVITLSADERIKQTLPQVSVTYVNAPAGCVETVNDNDAYARGAIILKAAGNDCAERATGGELGTSIEKVSNTEWIITVEEPEDTGYYSFYVEAEDRSLQRNSGSEGVSPGSIAADFFERDGDVNADDAHYFQGDIDLSKPMVRVSGVNIEDTEPTVEFKTPMFVELDFTKPYVSDCSNVDDDDQMRSDCYAESSEYAEDSFDAVTVTSFMLNGVDITSNVKTTDDETFLVSIDSIAIGDHEIELQAMDLAGNSLSSTLEIEFAVEDRDPFSKRLSPGWNLVSLPGEPADSDISVVFDSSVEVRTVYTYDPIIPGGWMVAVRETLDSEWQGDLRDITARRGYWVLSDAIQDWEVAIPRLAGGAVGTGTPIQPPVIALYAGWNLVPVVDVRGNALDDKKSIDAEVYLQNLDDGLDLARVLGFNTITNEWDTVLDPDDRSNGVLNVGSAYWVFVREAASLVPGGMAR